VFADILFHFAGILLVFGLLHKNHACYQYVSERDERLFEELTNHFLAIVGVFSSIK
jgi:hypothetical protein